MRTSGSFGPGVVACVLGLAAMVPGVARAVEGPAGVDGDLATAAEEAMEEFNERRIDAAMKRLKESLALDPADAEALNLLGACHINRREFGKAAETFAAAMALRPENRSILFNLAEAYFADKDWKTAQARYEELIPRLEGNPPLCSLCILKLYICRTKLADEAGADKLPGNLMSNAKGTPLANFLAAVTLSEVGKKDDAARQMELAGLNFTEKELAPWRDTMTEAGYLR